MTSELLVIIPCLNEEQTIESLVLQLLKNTANCNARIIIADGGSTDKTVEIAKKLASEHPQITYLHNPKRIQSAAVNLAVSTFAQNCDYFIRLDAHADYPDNYCHILLEEAQATGADSVVVAMDTQGKSGFQKAVAAAQNSKLGNGGSAHRAGITQGCWVDHGHHALMKVKAFNTAGHYDENFSHNEDAELDTRLTKAGCKIWLTAKTNLIYYPRPSPVKLFRQYMQYGKGRVRNILKHHTRPKLRQLLPVAVFPAALLALLFPFCKLMAVPFIAWAGLCIAYGALIGYKAHNVTLALSGPAAMIMHFSWSLGFWLGIREALLKNATGTHA